MKTKALDSSPACGCDKSGFNIVQGPARAGDGEDVRGCSVRPSLGRQDLKKSIIDRHDADPSTLCLFETQGPSMKVDLFPPQSEYLSPAHPGVECSQNDGLQMLCAVLKKPILLVPRQDSLFEVLSFREEPDLTNRILISEAPVDGQVEHLLEESQVAIDPGWAIADLEPVRFEGFDFMGSDALKESIAEVLFNDAQAALVIAPTPLARLGVLFEVLLSEFSKCGPFAIPRESVLPPKSVCDLHLKDLKSVGPGLGVFDGLTNPSSLQAVVDMPPLFA